MNINGRIDKVLEAVSNSPSAEVSFAVEYLPRIICFSGAKLVFGELPGKRGSD